MVLLDEEKDINERILSEIKKLSNSESVNKFLSNILGFESNRSEDSRSTK